MNAVGVNGLNAYPLLDSPTHLGPMHPGLTRHQLLRFADSEHFRPLAQNGAGPTVSGLLVYLKTCNNPYRRAFFEADDLKAGLETRKSYRTVIIVEENR